MVKNYIIVGRRLDDDDIKYLHGAGTANETVDMNAEKDGVAGIPLTVEFIGRTMVELSEGERLQKGTPEYDRMAGLLKHAMTVRPPTGHDPSDPELDRIWENTTIVIDYDERVSTQGQTDTNVRKLVVPVKETLAFREDEIAAMDNKPGFEPPLSYELDRRLMKAHFGSLFHDILDDARDSNNAPLSDDVKQALGKLIDERLGSMEDLANSADPAKQNMYAILNSPVSAFHRAVGIYITEMCN